MMRFLMDLFEVAFYCFLASAIYMVFSLIKNKKLMHTSSFYIAFLCFILLSIPYLPKLFGYETTQIGDFYEADFYTETYTVIMSREPEWVYGRKEYTLPAEIERWEDYMYTTDIDEDYYGNQYGGRDISSLNYHISYLYFPNGGYLSFEYDRAYDDPELTIVIPNKETKVTDYKGNEYYITLTKEKAK